MRDSLDSLLLDFIAWLDAAPRSYADVMDAWRTSCPRLPVWEEAVDRGLVQRVAHDRGVTGVALTPAGRELLARHQRAQGTM